MAQTQKPFPQTERLSVLPSSISTCIALLLQLLVGPHRAIVVKVNHTPHRPTCRAWGRLGNDVTNFCTQLLGEDAWVELIDGTTATSCYSNNDQFGPFIRESKKTAQNPKMAHVKNTMNDYLAEPREMQLLLRFVRNMLAHANDKTSTNPHHANLMVGAFTCINGVASPRDVEPPQHLAPDDVVFRWVASC